jgi:hypothetical protein
MEPEVGRAFLRACCQLNAAPHVLTLPILVRYPIRRLSSERCRDICQSNRAARDRRCDLIGELHCELGNAG